MDEPTFGSVFSGIGGLDLGLERAGWRCAWQVESDRYCRRILRKHWPGVTQHGDIRAVNFDRLERVDLIAGGFPCQPVSVAGKRKAQDDDRWLWPEFARAVRTLRPRLVLVENVPGLLVRGFGEVLGDLAASGYDAEWGVLPAAAFGAPHLRNRVFVVAYPNGDGQRIGEDEYQPVVQCAPSANSGNDGTEQPLAHAARTRGRRLSIRPTQQEPTAIDVERDGQTLPNADHKRHSANQQGQPGSIFGRADIGASDWWQVEPDVGRVAHGVSHRVDRIRVLGNAVVPQVAEWIGRRLMEVLHV